jgi:hypothetical protein
LSEETVAVGEADGEGEGLVSGVSLDVSSDDPASLAFAVPDRSSVAESLSFALALLADFPSDESPVLDLAPVCDFEPLEFFDFAVPPLDDLLWPVDFELDSFEVVWPQAAGVAKRNVSRRRAQHRRRSNR